MKKGKFLFLALALIYTGKVIGQASVPANNGIAANFLGWLPPNPFPLRIEHQGVFPINLTTAGNTNQMRLTTLAFGAPLFVGSAVNNVLPANRLSRVAISYDGNVPIVNPVSLLHLGEPGGAGMRHWMGNGTYVSQGSDNCFVGLRHKLNTDLSGRTSIQYIVTSPSADHNDAVINWGDNGQGPPGAGTDNLTFIHTDVETVGGLDLPERDNTVSLRNRSTKYYQNLSFLAKNTPWLTHSEQWLRQALILVA